MSLILIRFVVGAGAGIIGPAEVPVIFGNALRDGDRRGSLVTAGA
jgi:hypothetical protein